MRKIIFYPLVCLLLALSVIQIGAGLPAHAEKDAPEDDEWTRQLEAGLTAILAHQYEQAEASFTSAYTIAKQQDPVGPDAILSMTFLAQVANARHQDAKAKEIGQQALKLAEDNYPCDTVLLSPLMTLETIYLAQGQQDRAREVFARACNIATACMADDGTKTLETLFALGIYFEKLGQEETAAHCYTLACSLAERDPTTYAQDLAGMRYLLIKLYLKQGQYRAAEPIARAFLKMADDEAKTPTDARLVRPVQLLAQIEDNQGNPREALALYQRLLTLITALPGDQQVTLAHLQVGIATCEVALGQYQHAKERVLPAQVTLQALCAATDSRARMGLYVQGNLAREMGDFSECARILTRVGEQVQQHVDMASLKTKDDMPEIFLLLNLRGIYEFDLGQYATSLATMQQLKTLVGVCYGPTHPDTVQFDVALADITRKMGRLDEAMALCTQAMPVLLEAYGKNSGVVAEAQYITAQILLEQTKWQQAEPLLAQALATMTQAVGEGNPRVAKILVAQAEAKRQQQQYDDARHLAEQARAMMEACLGAENYQNGEMLHTLGRIADGQGKLADAEGYYRRALAIRQKALPAGHPDTIATLQAYADLLDKLHRPEEAAALRNQAAAVKEIH